MDKKKEKLKRIHRIKEGKRHRILGILLSAALVFYMLPLDRMTVYAEEKKVSAAYQEASWDGSQVNYVDKTADCTPVESSTEAVTWDAGWYAVNGTVTISEPVTVTGEVHLILADGCTLTAVKGIVVTTGNSLTIYAQSGGTGTLNVTGTTDSDNNASAGIGGSTEILDSGSITIHGGVINATGGYVDGMSSGAGIGGGASFNANGGNSGTVTIFGGVITASSGSVDLVANHGANYSGAGIGGGAGGNTGGAGNSITIYGGTVTADSQAGNQSGAGIGGGAGNSIGGAGNPIAIYGGNVTATSGTIGGSGGAGTGGGSGGNASGNGAVTISGGTVTAVGSNYAAGIGGGGGYCWSSQYGSGSVTGGIGSVTITGGIVDASSPTDVHWKGYEGAPIGNGGNSDDTPATVSKDSAIVFENGAGTVCGDVVLNENYAVPADYSLNIPGGNSLSGSGILSGGKEFTTENLTADMVTVSTDLCYNGQDRSEALKNQLSAELGKGIRICGQTFTASGWTVAAVVKTDDLIYTATYMKTDGPNTFEKTITLQKSGSTLAVKLNNAEGLVYTGAAQKPGVTVTADGQTLAAEGYTVSYSGNTNAGTATVTVTGKNYINSVQKTFSIQKAKPGIDSPPEAAGITYGQALYESVLSGAAYNGVSSEKIAGTFTWKDRFVKPSVSDSGKTEYTVVFTPDDLANYYPAETKVTLTVSKADNPPKKPGSMMNVSVNCSKVSDIVLPEDWKWQDSCRDTALSAGKTINAVAEYTGADWENFENTTAAVEITRSECSHIPGDFLYTQSGEKEPSCTKEGLGHRECTVCHEVIESEAAVPALGHDYTGEVTKEPTAEQEGVKTFTCSRCNDCYTESIPKPAAGNGGSEGGNGGGSGSGGGSAGGNGPAVTPEVPDTYTKTNSAGNTVVVTTTIRYGSNQSIISKTVKSVIEHAAENTAVTVTVKTDSNGKTTASATVVKTKTAAEKGNIISAAVVSQIKEAAGTADVMITWKVKDAGGKTKYTVKVNAGDLKKGSVLKIMKTDPETGEYVLVDAKNYPVAKNGNVSVTVDKKGTYILLNEADAKKYSDAIKKSIKVKESSKSVKAGKKTSIALNGKTNKNNIKKITYTSTDKSVASVDKKGKITAKKKGTVTIKAKVTLKNGVTKTVKMKLKVK